MQLGTISSAQPRHIVNEPFKRNSYCTTLRTHAANTVQSNQTMRCEYSILIYAHAHRRIVNGQWPRRSPGEHALRDVKYDICTHFIDRYFLYFSVLAVQK